MKRIALILLVCLLAFAACTDNKSAPVKQYDDIYKGVDFSQKVADLVVDGHTDYVVVVPKDRSEAVTYAAEELVSFFYQSTGAIMNIVSDREVLFSDELKAISLGNNFMFHESGIEFDASALNFDGFITKTLYSSVFINAYNDRGILYGVYDFIEKYLGVRFLTWDYTYVPINENVPLYKMDVVEVPAFGMRTYLDGSAYSPYADLPYYVRSRQNNTFVSVTEKFGGNSNVYARGLTHNFTLFVPRETYADSNPEFYHYDNIYKWWTIDLLNGITENGELDTTKDLSIAKIVIEEMKKDIIAMPDIDYFVFEQEDGPVYYPYSAGSYEEQQVEKYGRSGIMIRFCNMLAKELQDWADKELGGRKINIITFAYGYTLNAPLKYENGKKVPIDDTVIAADNLVIRLAFSGNRYYSYFSEKQDEVYRELFSDWSLIAKHFMFWGYDINYLEYLWYIPFLHRLSDDMIGFKDFGVQYMLIQAGHNAKTNWMDNMKSYLYTKLLWNPNLNVQELKEEYLNLYYGIAAPYVSQFIDLFDDHFALLFKEDSNIYINVGGNINYELPKYYKVELMEQAMEILNQADSAVRDSQLSGGEKDDLLVRIARVKTTPMYMTLYHYKYFYPYSTEKDKQDFAVKFFEACDLGEVTQLTELLSMSSLKTKYGLN